MASILCLTARGSKFEIGLYLVILHLFDLDQISRVGILFNRNSLKCCLDLTLLSIIEHEIKINLIEYEMDPK